PSGRARRVRPGCRAEDHADLGFPGSSDARVERGGGTPAPGEEPHRRRGYPAHDQDRFAPDRDGRPAADPAKKGVAGAPGAGVTPPSGAYGKAKVFLRARSTRASASGGKRPSRLTRRRLSTALICSVTALEGKAKPAAPFGITAWLGDTRAVFFV